MLDRWHNAPWTDRGLIFKYVVESVVMMTSLIVVMGIVGWIESI